MSVKDLILEIGTEEIPSGYIANILDGLTGREGSIVRGLFESVGIRPSKLLSYSTPRRIIMVARDIPVSQDIIIDGPPARIAFDGNKNPTKALDAFLLKNNAANEDIQIYRDEKEEKVRLLKKDVQNEDLLKLVLPKIIRSLSFPKTMRWDESDITFARPIRWIAAIFGNKIVEFSLGSIKSSNITNGHRFLGKQKIRVKDTGSFFKLLSKNHVIWDNEARKAKIFSFLEKKRWHINSALLDEVNNIVEFPFFIEGVFKKEYLGLPKEVLLASMAKHQRIFCLTDKNGSLTNRFAAVLNGKYNGRKLICRHYEEVLEARLKDALFFYQSDMKKPLSKWAESLADVVFHKKLGTLKDKVERLKKITHFLAKYIDIRDEEKKLLAKAIPLLKADLLTQMVSEFPSLQGVVGRAYALASGEEKGIAQAIEEHYLPRFSDDRVPETLLGAVCSLADKFDNIICYFKIGKFPKGSWDLYALRRQAIGIISILLKLKVELSLSDVFDYVYDITPADCDKGKLKSAFLDFFRERFIYFVKEKYNYRYDLIDSVVGSGADNIFNSFLKLEALNSIIDEVCFEKARCIVERTYNIIKSSKADTAPASERDVKKTLFSDEQESVLYEKYNEIRERFRQSCENRKYEDATKLYADNLSEDVHNFFDKVMVNVDDKAVRQNRINLLAMINRLYVDNVADLAKIVVNQ